MFGFLKKKLKDAVKKFTKKAEEEVVEEKVDDKAAIAKAKQEEKQILKKAEKVKEIPETPDEKAQHEKEAREKKAAPKKVQPKPTKPAPKPAPKPAKAAPPKPAPKKPEPKVAPKKTVPEKPKKEIPVKETPKKEEPVPDKKVEPVKEEPVKEAKPGFLKKLFKKKEPVPEPEPIPEKPIEPEVPEEPPEEKVEPVEEEPEEEPVLEEEPIPEEPIPEEPEEEPVLEEEPVPEEPEEPKPKRGLFAKLKDTFTKKSLSPEKFEEMFWDLEVVLLENNVALEVIEKLKEDMKQDLTTGKVSRLGIDDMILVSLRESVDAVLDISGFDLVKKIKKDKKRPYTIAFIGVNGSGKTTTLAKIANLFQEEGLGVVIAASDTFRAAAIDQLKEHADRLAIKMISQGYGADPAAVAYDAIEHAKAKNQDVVMIDTAGRLHSNTNLMAELEKVVRVAKPDLKIFIGESITGNDCVEQAKQFDKAVGIDAIILSKADVDEKGGAALSVSWVTKKPILYLGVGQAYGDLKAFDKDEIVKSLGL